MRDQSIHLFAAERDTASLVVQCAADTIDQCTLTGTVGSDQADTLTLDDMEINGIEGDEATEPLAQLAHLQQRGGHACDLLLTHFCHNPTMPLGATITKPISSKPTMSRFTAEEIVTVATCCSVP